MYILFLKLAANISFKFDSGDEDEPGNKSDQSDTFRASPLHDIFSDEYVLILFVILN